MSSFTPAAIIEIALLVYIAIIVTLLLLKCCRCAKNTAVSNSATNVQQPASGTPVPTVMPVVVPPTTFVPPYGTPPSSWQPNNAGILVFGTPTWQPSGQSGVVIPTPTKTPTVPLQPASPAPLSTNFVPYTVPGTRNQMWLPAGVAPTRPTTTGNKKRSRLWWLALLALLALLLCSLCGLFTNGFGLLNRAPATPVATITATPQTPTTTPQPTQPPVNNLAVDHQCSLGTDTAFPAKFVFSTSYYSYVQPNSVWLDDSSLPFDQFYQGQRFGDGVDGSSAGGWQHPGAQPSDWGIPWLRPMGLELPAPKQGIIRMGVSGLYAYYRVERRGACNAFVLYLTTNAHASRSEAAVRFLEWDVLNSGRTLYVVA